MASLREAIAAVGKRPGRTIVLEPWVFADDWGGKPATAICVGLRLMSEADKGRARNEAEKIAFELHARGGPNWVDAFNDALVRFVVAFGICDPNDVERPSEILPLAEDQVRRALTARGARFIFDAVHRYEVETSALAPEADDADLDELGTRIEAGEIERLTGASRALARRFLRYALDEIRAQ